MAESIKAQELLNIILGRLTKISKNTQQSACCGATTSAGSGTNVPAGFASVSIILLGGSINVTMSDGSIYPMTVANEVLVQAAPQNKYLPAIIISGSGTWKWSAIK